jgi:hypothetical protein
MSNRLYYILIFTAIVASMTAQNSVIFGIIRDIDSNQGIDFVTVYIDGTTNVTESDNNGQYKITTDPNKKVILKFSRLGYTDLTVNVESMQPGQKRNINVKMVPKASDLEIVVRAGKIEDVGMVEKK